MKRGRGSVLAVIMAALALGGQGQRNASAAGSRRKVTLFANTQPRFMPLTANRPPVGWRDDQRKRRFKKLEQRRRHNRKMS